VKPLDYINEIVQGLVILFLIYNAIKTQTMTLFQITITLMGVTFNFYAKYLSKQKED